MGCDRDARVESRLRPILEVVKLRLSEGIGEILAVMGAYGNPQQFFIRVYISHLNCKSRVVLYDAHVYKRNFT
jgi:hypothetical protein